MSFFTGVYLDQFFKIICKTPPPPFYEQNKIRLFEVCVLDLFSGFFSFPTFKQPSGSLFFCAQEADLPSGTLPFYLSVAPLF
jgi:hypothetical protein